MRNLEKIAKIYIIYIYLHVLGLTCKMITFLLILIRIFHCFKLRMICETSEQKFDTCNGANVFKLKSLRFIWRILLNN